MKDPYAVLGVDRNASDEEIRTAYKVKVKASHPDTRPGDPAAADDFRAVQSAYERIRKERALEREARRSTPPPRTSSSRAPPPRPSSSRPPPRPSTERFDRVFREKREEARFGRSPYAKHVPERGTIEVPFAASILGGDHRLSVSFLGTAEPATLRVSLPSGVIDGERLRVEGKVVRVVVRPDPYLRREGDDVVVDLPLRLSELALGAVVEVPTVEGSVELRVPAGTRTGQRLRLRGRGVSGKGDQLCVVQAVPPALDEEKEALFRRLDTLDRDSPRPWERKPRSK